MVEALLHAFDVRVLILRPVLALPDIHWLLLFLLRGGHFH